MPDHGVSRREIDGGSRPIFGSVFLLPLACSYFAAWLLLAKGSAFQAFDEFYGVMATAQGCPPCARARRTEHAGGGDSSIRRIHAMASA